MTNREAKARYAAGLKVGFSALLLIAMPNVSAWCGTVSSFAEDKSTLPALEKNLRLPAGRLGTPEDLGAAALFLCSRASSWITGEILSVSGGM